MENSYIANPIGWCVKCKKKVPIQNSHEETISLQKKLEDSKSEEKELEPKELEPKKEGCFVYSTQLDEKPINLMLKLNFLIQQGVAKQIHPKIP
ncbi:hypothetical protein LCGC14_2437870 [marine sediment metagenome]|uniref:Uncharacterized protein n=1 Tax=marine sediment metagenome TaxID=412755 RepID=A0A0F9C7F5_9ZZZZ